MNTTIIKTGKNRRPSASLLHACLNTCGAVRNKLESVKERILHQRRELVQGRERLLKLALNEAEAVAWQTGYPHLVFPTLALEKAEAAVLWQRRQRTIQQRGEVAFAA